jgi:flavodoxin
MDMRVGRALTYKAIFYYSSGGNTKSIVDETNTTGFNVINMNKIKPNYLSFFPYEIIIIGCPSYGKGVPPNYFREIAPQLMSLRNKKIGLFGSGQSIYGDRYCGALDVLENLLRNKNEILFVHRFESYPTDLAVMEFQELINQC